ncbi:MAG: hypothetical protein GY794_09985 [bacterium]|nr:hypothetical protein [bacterium]
MKSLWEYSRRLFSCALHTTTTTDFATEFTKNGNGEKDVTANGQRQDHRGRQYVALLAKAVAVLCVLAVVVAFAVTKFSPLPLPFFVNSVAKVVAVFGF